MYQALGHILPIAVAVALSSVPIMATILILLSPKRGRSAVPYLIGWVLGLVVVVVLCALGAQAIPDPPPRQPQLVVGVVEIVIGLALVVFAVVSWRRSLHSPGGEIPKWLHAVGTFGALASFGVAFALNFRPKGLLLGVAAGLAVAEGSLDAGGATIVIVVYTAISASTVAAPIIVTLAAPRRMQPRLIVARDWITRNNRVVTALIMIMIGVVIIGSGLSRL
ncbi:GAP family protein [Compostimonas suwonensis]|uniref:Sap-like sulfolipid-1-addressing protein n=1 Tax=Compostimonas suwonensis TaxID=1048394 RepID=A0A2M9BVP5_9MICO|nr:GAP family protein [Compostimonas suwonensis]PJJ62023.1 Sap-like sulfolipid-1-addressing protein [Compostimonas suwonensis]